MSVARRLIASGIVLLGSCLSAPSQVTESARSTTGDTARAQDSVPRVPGLSNLFSGFNAGVSYFGAHNSAIGWYSVATPAVSYSFSRHYSADASASIYFHRLVENLDPGAPPNQRLVLDAVDASDTFLSFHATYLPRHLQDTITASLSLPTGNSSEGLGTGHVTYDFTNHVERDFEKAGIFLDLGAGNSSTLSNNIVTKDYSSLGPLVHFETGSIFWWRGNYMEMLAYEQLPVGSQTVYTSYSPTDGSTQTVVSSPSISEDNGITVIAGIPLTSKLTALSYYNRSLRHHSDTVSFGLTYVLRGSQKSKWMSMIDRALREAERDPQ